MPRNLCFFVGKTVTHIFHRCFVNSIFTITLKCSFNSFKIEDLFPFSRQVDWLILRQFQLTNSRFKMSFVFLHWLSSKSNSSFPPSLLPSFPSLPFNSFLTNTQMRPHFISVFLWLFLRQIFILSMCWHFAYASHHHRNIQKEK